MHSLETFRIRKTKPEFEIVCIKSLEKKGLEEPYKIKTNPRKRLRSLLKTTDHISIRPLTGKKSKIMTPRPKRRSKKPMLGKLIPKKTNPRKKLSKQLKALKKQPKTTLHP